MRIISVLRCAPGKCPYRTGGKGFCYHPDGPGGPLWKVDTFPEDCPLEKEKK